MSLTTDHHHPLVAQIVRTIEGQNKLRPFDLVTVEEREHSPGRKFVTIRAERHAGTLAATTLQVFVRTSGPRRGKFLGGTVYRTLTPDQKIRTYRDLRIHGF